MMCYVRNDDLTLPLSVMTLKRQRSGDYRYAFTQYATYVRTMLHDGH